MTIMRTRNNRRLGFTLIELMLVIAIIAILAAILTPSFLKARAQSQLTACKSNVKNIGTACEMFAIDRKGRYPEQIAFLTLGANGGYLKSIPSCPAAGYDTYSASYTFASNPDCFTVRCGGANHVALNIPVGYPLYDSVVGLACSGEPGDDVVAAGNAGNDSQASAAQQKAAEEAAAQQKAAEEAAAQQKAAEEAAAQQKAAEEAAAQQKAAEEAAAQQKAAEEAAAQQKAAEEAAAQRAAAISAGTKFLNDAHAQFEGCWNDFSTYKGRKDPATDNARTSWIIYEQEAALVYSTALTLLEPYNLDGIVSQFPGRQGNAYPLNPCAYNPIDVSKVTEDQIYELGVTLLNADTNGYNLNS